VAALQCATKRSEIGKSPGFAIAIRNTQLCKLQQSRFQQVKTKQFPVISVGFSFSPSMKKEGCRR